MRGPSPESQLNDVVGGLPVRGKVRPDQLVGYLAAIVESSDDAIVGLSLDGTVLSWNGGATRHYGYAAEEMVGRPFSMLIPPDQPDDLLDILGRIESGELTIRFESVRIRKDGSRLSVSVNVAPIADAAGNVVGASTIARDLSDRDRAEAELRAAAHYARSLLEASLDALVTISPEGKITDVNAATEQITGLARERLIGTDFSEYFTQPERARSGYEQVFRDGLVRDYPLVIHHASGALTDVLYNASVYRDASGEIIGVFAAARDITERKLAEELIHDLNEDLRRRARELETANRELEAFSYSVSHDLRAPLRAIDGFSHALLEDYSDVLDDAGREYLNRVTNAANRMGALIDSLLMLSRLSRREMDVETVDLSAIVREISRNLAEEDPGRGVSFSIADELHASADPVLIRNVLENLLGNAWKFTSREAEAHIEFGLATVDGQPVFFVKDNGTGFDMTYADKLFGAFQRLHDQGDFPGTGVGLATVARVIHRHGGRVWAEGSPGEGAIFYFTLP